MRTEWDDAKLDDWIDRFKKAAVLFHNGQYLAARAMEQAGSDACNALIRDLDAGHNRGRDILLPLLHDKQPYVQVSAAVYLVTKYPDIVVPILKHLQENDVSGADFTAQCVLWLHEDGWYVREAAKNAV